MPDKNYSKHQSHHMKKEELLDYLVSRMVEDNGVYKTVIDQSELIANPELTLLRFRKDIMSMVLTIPEAGKTTVAKFVQELFYNDTENNESITVVYSPEIGKLLMNAKNQKKDS